MLLATQNIKLIFIFQMSFIITTHTRIDKTQNIGYFTYRSYLTPVRPFKNKRNLRQSYAQNNNNNDMSNQTPLRISSIIISNYKTLTVFCFPLYFYFFAYIIVFAALLHFESAREKMVIFFLVSFI